jgi:hypothetical protein
LKYWSESAGSVRSRMGMLGAWKLDELSVTMRKT